MRLTGHGYRIDSPETRGYNVSMKCARTLTAWTLAASAFLALTGLACASWSDLWKQWTQGLGSNEDGHQSQAVAAVRGAWDKEGAAKDSDRRNYAAIEKLDRLDVSASDVEQFIEEGRLAP